MIVQSSHLAAPPLSAASLGCDRRASPGRDRRKQQSTAGAEYLCRGTERVLAQGIAPTPVRNADKTGANCLANFAK